MTDIDSDEESDEGNIWRSLTTEIRHHLGADPPLSQFLQQLDLRQKTSPPSAGDVQCLTIHLAKGKEFRHVYLIGLAEEQLPSFHAVRGGSATMEEERPQLLRGHYPRSVQPDPDPCRLVLRLGQAAVTVSERNGSAPRRHRVLKRVYIKKLP